MKSQIVPSPTSAANPTCPREDARDVNVFPLAIRKKKKKETFQNLTFELRSAVAAVLTQDYGASARDGSLHF